MLVAAAMLAAPMAATTGAAQSTDDTTLFEGVQTDKLNAEDPQNNQWFGFSVDVAGDTAILGAPKDSEHHFNAGAAYIFSLGEEGWTQEAKLLPRNPFGGDGRQLAGWSVGIDADGDTAVVGARGFTHSGTFQAGEVFVYEKAGGEWSQVAHLYDENPGRQDQLGVSVVIDEDGDTIVAGSTERGSSRSYGPGKALVFERQDGDWTETARLTPSDGDRRDTFGNGISMDADGDTVAIGAREADRTAHNGGAVYVFEETDGTWEEAAILADPDAQRGDKFGANTALSPDGETLLVNSAKADAGARNAGSVHVYEHGDDGWTATQKLHAPDPDVGERFGSSMAIVDGVAVLGSKLEDLDGLRDAGEAYLYLAGDDGFSHAGNLSAADAEPGDRLGRDIALTPDGATAFVTSRFDDLDAHRNAGSAYTFATTGPYDPVCNDVPPVFRTVSEHVDAADGALSDVAPEETEPITKRVLVRPAFYCDPPRGSGGPGDRCELRYHDENATVRANASADAGPDEGVSAQHCAHVQVHKLSGQRAAERGTASADAEGDCSAAERLVLNVEGLPLHEGYGTGC